MDINVSDEIMDAVEEEEFVPVVPRENLTYTHDPLPLLDPQKLKPVTENVDPEAPYVDLIARECLLASKANQGGIITANQLGMDARVCYVDMRGGKKAMRKWWVPSFCPKPEPLTTHKPVSSKSAMQ